MKGTRLWQAPGSPIIQGRSRTERPFWERWMTGIAGAEAIVLGVALFLALRPGVGLEAALGAVVLSSLLPGLPGSLAGSALGVLLARTMGWRRHWLAGAVIGAALAALTIAVF